MIDFLANVAATTIEGSCIFILTLSLFRFRARDHILEIGIANIVVSVSNYLMEHYNFFYDYTATLNILVMIGVFIFLFRISTLDTIIMTVCGFAIVLVIQLIMVSVFTIFNQITVKQLRLEDAQYYMQIISGVIFLALTWILNKKHWWFTFIPFKRSFKIKITSLNLGVLVTATALIALLSFFLNMNNLLLAILISLIPLSAVLCVSIKKEKQYD